MIDTTHLSLGQAQELFTRLENKWVAWCLEQPGWELRHGEGCLLKSGPMGDGRKALLVGSLQPVKVIDRVHMPDSLHYHMLAQDWQLFVYGRWVTQTDDPMWTAAGEKAEEIGLSWGGRFRDGNHISLAWGGKK